MVVRDRSKHKNNTDEVFKQAKRKGAKQGHFEPHRRSSSRNFTGTGRLLTGETVQHDAPQPPEEIVHNIYFWSNGFTVNDGPLRSFDDPANASFLESIKNSDCPTELEPADGKSKVNVNLVRKEEEFTVSIILLLQSFLKLLNLTLNNIHHCLDTGASQACCSISRGTENSRGPF
jgi:UBX domain-containing protein 1